MPSPDFTHVFARPDGGEVALRMSEKAVSVEIPDRSQQAQEALSGLGQLAKMLERNVAEQSAAPASIEASRITKLDIKTNGQDPSIALVVAKELEGQGYVVRGSEQQLKNSLEKAGHLNAPEKEQAQEQGMDAKLAAIGAALRNASVQAANDESFAAKVTSQQDRGPGRSR